MTGTPRRATSDFWDRYREKRDVIFFDQRGTGFSEPHFCPEMSAVFNTVRYRGLSPKEETARKVAAARECRKKMQAKGVDFSAYNSAASARDRGGLRQLLDGGRR